MKKKLLTFVLTFVLWFVLAGRFNIQVFLLGTIICSIISLMMAENLFRLIQMKDGTKDFPKKLYYIFMVIIAFIYDVFLSAFKVSRHAFEMKPSFSPRLVSVQTSLENSNSMATLVHFFTLPQGALAMDFDDIYKEYVIHWIDVDSDDEVEGKKTLILKHENLIAKIFD
ncbi:Na+/H+ antiporter subunit E [Aquibacillus rhizosphaerae]|uniref:Na+/H+ antiporter subunit E n=1 Tax=Aquibacillus rhizosphaerae TaxID=3051431 RepID=A0ABT7L9C5_9BACI|nr:Na+/H+ antiporter subunit E [Aquibacillus sp. LR5S19]MDL4842453.1 Na+/H+ antiporter subunit E [Aquibacillus sp. LR5S19]